jgi:hypothetical protein
MRSDLGLGFFRPSEDGGLLELRLVCARTAFQFRHLGRQPPHMLYLRKQRTNQRVFLANAELGKIGKFVHADANASSMPWT